MKNYSRFYKCVYFKIQELVDPETYASMGENAWSLFDTTLLSTLDRIRDRYKVPITINNWNNKIPNPFKYRGFRPASYTAGAPLSMHRVGKAIDFDVAGMKAEQVRKDILANPEHLDFMFISRIEMAVNWCHIDVANVPTRIQTFSKVAA